MNRRQGMFTAIICVLVVGGSVTKMTRDFVSSKGAETAAITSVMGITGAAAPESFMLSEAAAVPAAGSMERIIAEAGGTAGAEGFSAGGGQSAAGASLENAAAGQSLDGGAEPLEKSADTAGTAGKYASGYQTENPDIGISAYAADAAGAAVAEEAGEMAALTEADGEGAGQDLGAAATARAAGISGAEAGNSGAPGSLAETGNAGTSQSAAGTGSARVSGAASGPGGTDGAELSAEEAEAMQETVRSPLETAAAEEAEKRYTADELRARLDHVAEQVLQYGESTAEMNAGAAFAAAEYERNLWDAELNLIYTSIRQRISEQEAEQLKLKELEWIRERDRAAEKASLRNSNQLTGQSVEYTKKSAEKTKERCYELLEEYEEVLSENE